MFPFLQRHSVTQHIEHKVIVSLKLNYLHDYYFFKFYSAVEILTSLLLYGVVLSFSGTMLVLNSGGESVSSDVFRYFVATCFFLLVCSVVFCLLRVRKQREIEVVVDQLWVNHML